jgi:hypothetical protein
MTNVYEKIYSALERFDSGITLDRVQCGIRENRAYARVAYRDANIGDNVNRDVHADDDADRDTHTDDDADRDAHTDDDANPNADADSYSYRRAIYSNRLPNHWDTSSRRTADCDPVHCHGGHRGRPR